MDIANDKVKPSSSNSSFDTDSAFEDLVRKVAGISRVLGEEDDVHKDENVEVEMYEKFENPMCLPLNQIHLESYITKQVKDLPDNLTDDDCLDDLDMTKYFNRETIILPALNKAWILIDGKEYHPYQPFHFGFGQDENNLFLCQNTLFNQDLEELLLCNYHKFWCHILFEPRLTNNIIDFILKPIFWYEYNFMEGENFQLFVKIYNNVYKILEKLLEFRHSDEEYMEEETILKYLEETKFLNMPVIINFAVMYGERDPNLILKLFSHISTPKRVQQFNGQVQNMIKRVLIVLEMIGGHICGFEEGAKITPIAIAPKPNVFDPFWYNDAITYILETIVSTHALFIFYKNSVELVIEKGLPYRMTYFYDRVFTEIHKVLNEEWKVADNDKLEQLREHIFDHLYKCRAKWVQTFEVIVSNVVDKILLHVGDSANQMKYVELFLKLITSAMEDEMFFADYHSEYPVDSQIDNIAELYPEIDKMRTDFIIQCIHNNPTRFSGKRDVEVQTLLTSISRLKLDLESTDPDTLLVERVASNETNADDDEYLSKEVVEEALAAIGSIPPDVLKMLSENSGNVTDELYDSVLVEVRAGASGNFESENDSLNEDQVEQAINDVISALPHLGDGFILKCLEYYNYNPNEVISAILDENLAPHLMELPYNEVRIPSEPEPPQPIKKHIGKKPYNYKDAGDLLNDKSALTKEVRESITNRYLYDDDYDDSIDDPVVMKDYSMLGRDASEIHEVIQDDSKLVSEPESTSEEEFDDDGKPVSGVVRDAFCEDPAVVRERREQQRRLQQRGKHPPPKNKVQGDVHGKPKGEGQDKNVRVNREKKNVHKSSRANHNRKSGAQWKRSRTMVPS